MRNELIATALLFGGLLVAITPASAQAAPTWTVELIDGAITPNFFTGTGADRNQPFPAVAVMDTATGERLFYSKQSGTWTKNVVATIADQSPGSAGAGSAIASLGGGNWALMLNDDAANLERSYLSADDGLTWTPAGTVAEVNSCGPHKDIDVFGSSWGIWCYNTAGTGAGLLSTNGGTTWINTINSAFACTTSNAGSNLQFLGGTEWTGYGSDPLDGGRVRIKQSLNNCATSGTTTRISPEAATADTETAIYSRSGAGIVYLGVGGLSASQYIGWNPVASPPNTADTQTILAAGPTPDNIFALVVAETTACTAVVGVPISGTGGVIMLMTCDGVNWATQTLPTTVDPGSSNFLDASFVNGTMSLYYVDAAGDLVHAYSDSLVGEAPDAPAGLSALVSQAHDGVNTEIELRWPVSANDPDLINGSFRYDMYLNGVNIGADGTTSADSDGIRFSLIIYGNPVPSNALFWITATNTVNGLTSAASCSVQVFTGTQNDFDQCGDLDAPLGGGVVVAPSDTAAGLRGFCASLMGDSDGSLFLCGLIFVVAAFLAMAGGFAAITGSAGLGPTIAGSVAGFGMMVFNVFAGIWGVVWAIVLIILVAAIITLVVKKFTGASGGATDG